MPLKDTLDVHVEYARYLKEATCSKGPEDIRPVITIERGNQPIALIWLRDHVREEILQIATAASALFAADVIGAIFETYISVAGSRDTSQINPITGKPYRDGEMQDVALHHDGIAKGWVREAVACAVVTRAGDDGFANLPFHYAAGALSPKPRLVWDDDVDLRWLSTEEDHAVAGGYIQDVLKGAMTSIELGRLITEIGQTELDRNQQDVQVAQFLMQKADCEVAMWTSESDRARVDYLLRHGNIINPE